MPNCQERGKTYITARCVSHKTTSIAVMRSVPPALAGGTFSKPLGNATGNDGSVIKDLTTSPPTAGRSSTAVNRLILLTVLFMAPAVALSQTKTSKEIDGLVAPVHTVITVSVSYTKIDGVWTEGTKATTLVFTYDENGND